MMKQERIFPRVTVTKKGEAWVDGGHPWIYDAEIVSAPEEYENGTLVDAVSSKGKYLGTGFISRNSKIRVRLLSHNANDKFDADFFRRRIKYAWDYRKTVMGGDIECCRVIFGEADGFPGLTVDRFGEVLVTQSLSVGIEKYKDIIFPALYEVLSADGQKISGIYERNDVAIRSLEGLPENKGWYSLEGIEHPNFTETEIVENGIKYSVDFENGQKTGFFLDQKYNRRAIRSIARGRRVLDCFTHTGSFGLNAAAAGALEVESVDISAAALEVAAANARRNGLSDRIRYTEADAFDYLRALGERGRRACPFDFIILDPPALTKTRDTLKNAIRGYRDINTAAMRALPRGGYLATCSCSHFMTDTNFLQMLHNSAEDAGVSLRQIELRKQAPDHPILWNVPETDYLVFGIFQIV